MFSLKQGIPGTSRRKLAPSSFNLEVSMFTSGVQYGDAASSLCGIAKYSSTLRFWPEINTEFSQVKGVEELSQPKLQLDWFSTNLHNLYSEYFITVNPIALVLIVFKTHIRVEHTHISWKMSRTPSSLKYPLQQFSPFLLTPIAANLNSSFCFYDFDYYYPWYLILSESYNVFLLMVYLT